MKNDKFTGLFDLMVTDCSRGYYDKTIRAFVHPINFNKEDETTIITVNAL